MHVRACTVGAAPGSGRTPVVVSQHEHGSRSLKFVIVLPGLLGELHTLYVTDPEHRTDVLTALMDCSPATGILLKNLGIRGLPSLAAFRAQQVAEELDDPAWLGLAAWLRASALGSKGRPRMLAISVQDATN